MPAPVKRQATPLFGQEDDVTSAKGDVDADADPEERDDDWIIDDLGDGMEEEGKKEYGAGGLREMGIIHKFLKGVKYLSLFCSERNKSATNLPACLNTATE